MATCTWAGTSSGDGATAGNWDAAPVAGDSIVVGNTSTNALASWTGGAPALVAGTLGDNKTGAGAAVAYPALTFSGAVTVSGATGPDVHNCTFNGAVTLVAAATIGAATFNAVINLNTQVEGSSPDFSTALGTPTQVNVGANGVLGSGTWTCPIVVASTGAFAEYEGTLTASGLITIQSGGTFKWGTATGQVVFELGGYLVGGTISGTMDWKSAEAISPTGTLTLSGVNRIWKSVSVVETGFMTNPATFLLQSRGVVVTTICYTSALEVPVKSNLPRHIPEIGR